MLLVLHAVGLPNCLNKVRNFTMNAFQVQSRCPEAEFMTIQFLWGFWAYSWEFWELKFPCTFTMFHTTFAHKGGEVKSIKRWRWIARRKTLKTFVPITSKNSASDQRDRRRDEDRRLGSIPLSADPVFVNLLRSPGIDSQPCGSIRQPYLSYWPARLHRLAESIPRNRPGIFKRLQIRALGEWWYITVADF